VNEFNRGLFSWSNELVLHLIEIKTNGPATRLENLGAGFQEEINLISEILEYDSAILMPTAMHPWMDPDKEMKLWPHEYNPIYEAYNRIFDCRGHGWGNLQSTHLNLPFADDHEFEKLHAACRLILPLIPALAASSPIADCKIKPYLDFRMEVYRTNSIRIPSVTGLVIPEAVFSEHDYRELILDKMYRDIVPHDPEGILQEEWLNSRGALTRFGRKAVEIRVIDIQETAFADIAILYLIVSIIQHLVAEKTCLLKDQKNWSDRELYEIFLDVIQHGEKTCIRNRRFLSLFGVEQKDITAGQFWFDFYSGIQHERPFPAEFKSPLDIIFSEGPLARRILKSMKNRITRKKLDEIYRELSHCLIHGQLFIP
jgi:glutamate---cysteine ligase / carboxylate-amine ligase